MTTIRIKRSEAGEWQTVTLLEWGGGWYRVDDGNGPLWVSLDHVHPGDARRLAKQSLLVLACDKD